MRINPYPLNFAVVDNFLLRSSMPTDIELYAIKDKYNLTDVINLSDNASQRMLLVEEKGIKELGLNYHKIPSKTDNPLLENVQKFLNIMSNVRQNGRKALVHCNAGVDRTGTFVVFYELANKLRDFDAAIKNMIAMGHFPEDCPLLKNRIVNIAKQMKFIK